MKRVYHSASLLAVAHARNLLTAAGIHADLRNEFLIGALGDLPMLETWPQLWVDDVDAPRALKTLDAAAAPPAGEAWICPACAEPLEPQFSACWRCGAER